MKLRKTVSALYEQKNNYVRLLEDVVLHVFLVPTIFEHLGHADGSSHTAAERGTNLRRMNVLVEFIGIGDSRHVESFGSADERPQRRPIRLGDDVVRNTVSAGVPSGGDLSCDGTAEGEALRHKDECTFFELEEPLSALSGPDVALVAVLELELVRLGLRDFDGLKIVDKFDFLVEDLLLRVIAAEEFGFCSVCETGVCDKRANIPISRTPACSKISFWYRPLTSLSSTGSPVLLSTQPT